MRRIIKIEADNRKGKCGYIEVIMQFENGSKMPVTMTAEEYAIQDAKEHIADMVEVSIGGETYFSAEEIMKWVEIIEEKAREQGRQDEADSNNPDL